MLSAPSEPKSNRVSAASSNDEETATNVDQLVVAQVHHDPIPEVNSEVTTEANEVTAEEGPTAVTEPPKGLYKITCRHKKFVINHLVEELNNLISHYLASYEKGDGLKHQNFSQIHY